MHVKKQTDLPVIILLLGLFYLFVEWVELLIMTHWWYYFCSGMLCEPCGT